MDLIGHGLKHVLEELPGSLSVSRCNELSDSELGRPVDADEQVKLALGGLHLGNVPSRGLLANRCRAADVKEPDGIAFELLASGLVTLDMRQARDAVPLQAPMQR